MTDKVVPVQPESITEYIDTFSTGLRGYLQELGLPCDEILVDVNERAAVIRNLPQVASQMQPESRQSAMYVSKFVAACGVGLFDAALNYIWDETVRNLRVKVAMFDIAYFFDAVVTDSARRAKLKDASDLDKLEEWELIRGCRDTGLITDIGFRHLERF